MTRKFYCAKKERYDVLSADTLYKVCSASGVNAEGLSEFSRFEISGLSDDGFEKCKGLFYDAFSEDIYENEVVFDDAATFVFDENEAINDAFAEAVRIVSNECADVKCARIVRVYGVKKEDEGKIEKILRLRFAENRQSNISSDEKRIKEAISKTLEKSVDYREFAHKLFDDNVTKISKENIKFSKNFDENREKSKKIVATKIVSDKNISLKTFSGQIPFVLTETFSEGFIPVSAVVTSYFSKKKESTYHALENAKRISDFLEKSCVSAFSESFVAGGNDKAEYSVAVTGVKKIETGKVEDGNGVLLLTKNSECEPELYGKLKRLFENPEAVGLIRALDTLGNVLKYGATIDLKKRGVSEDVFEKSIVIVAEDTKKLLKILKSESVFAEEIGEISLSCSLIKSSGKKFEITKNNVVSAINTDISENLLEYNQKNVDETVRSLLSASRPREALLVALSKDNVAGKTGLDEVFDGKASVFDFVGGTYRLTKENVAVSEIDGAYAVTAAATAQNDFSGGFDAAVLALSRLYSSGADDDATVSISVRFSDFEKAKEGLLGAMTVVKNLGVGVSSVNMVSSSCDVVTVASSALSEKIVGATFSDNGKLIRIKLKSSGAWDFDRMKSCFDFARGSARANRICSSTVVSEGGVAISAIKSCLGNGKGIVFSGDIDENSFACDCGDVLLLTKDDAIANAGAADVIGDVTDIPKYILNDTSLRADAAERAYDVTFEKIFPATAYSDGYTKNLGISFTKKKVCAAKISRPRVFLPVFDTNYNDEFVRRFKAAGARTEVLSLCGRDDKEFTKSVEEFAKTLKNCQILALTDGNLLMNALFMRDEIKASVEELLSRDGLILGIGKGFEVLLKTGLLPYGKFVDEKNVKANLKENITAKKTCGARRVRVASNLSPWFNGVKTGDVFKVRFSEEVGRFVADKKLLDMLIVKGQIATQYVDLNGNATMETPFNPSGSEHAVEGLFSPDGRIFGRTSRFETVSDNLLKNVPGESDAKIFESGVKYFK